MSQSKLFIILVFMIFSTSMFAGIIVTNGLTQQFNVKGGSVQRGVISIENTLSQDQEVKLYQLDYSYTAQGSATYQPYGNNSRSNLKWIKLNSNLVNVGPLGKLDIAYEIKVPQNALPGSTWSVIMVEPVDKVIPTEQSSGVQLKSVIRYSIQIITTLQDSGESIINFDDLRLVKTQGKRLLEIDLSNQGTLYHELTASIELFDSVTGAPCGVYHSDTMGLLPSNSKKFVIDLSQAGFGMYAASVLVRTNQQSDFGLNIELDLANE